MSTLFVERVVDESVFTSGIVTLTRAEAERLQLPAHPESVALEHRDGRITVGWQSGTRQLGGESLLDLIELNARVDGLMRLHPPIGDGEPIGVQFLERPAGPRYRGMIEVVPNRAGTSSADQRRSVDAGRAKGSRALDRQKIRDRSEFTWFDTIGISKTSLETLEANLESAAWDDPTHFELRVEGEELATISGFDELLALDIASVDHLPHQEATALKVLGRLRGRAILADEVGLGKTIEAGLIMKELMQRGLAVSALVICPATLREQWRDELRDKFHEEFDVATSAAHPMRGDRLILSHQLARTQLTRLTARRWDIVVVDEAHRMAGKNAMKSRELLQQLESRYALYLTATPVQNNLLELYRLVDTLRPGTFRSERDFKTRFMGATPQEPKNPEGLRRLISDVVVRTTRAQAGLDKIARIPKDFPITLSSTERQVYELCVTALRRHLNGPHDHLRRRQLAHRLTASPRALGSSARRLAELVDDPRARAVLHELADLCVDFGITSRQQKLLELVTEWVEDPEKGRVLVFTQHTDTLEDLLRIIHGAGISAVAFHGGMAASAKQESLRQFRAGRDKGAPVMVSTESGAEGLNLQFANCVVNYDLPWNPMRIEQRIGRVHRVTQTRDVYVANFFARDTIDESVYRLLHDKLRMFELLFGQVTTILGELDDGSDRVGSFETRVLDALVAPSDAEMERKIDELGRKVDAAYAAAQTQIDTGGTSLTSLVFDTSHRAGLTREGATELTPEAVSGERQRHLAVERFALRYLEVIGAKIEWHQPGDEHEAGFLTAVVPEASREALGGRTRLHLAFGGDAMAQHADAELCTAGTEMFEQIVDSLAERGDLVAMVPNEARFEPTTQWFKAAPGLTFVRRDVAVVDRWGSEAVWRVRTRPDRDGDRLLTTFSGETDADGEVLRPLEAGERYEGLDAAVLDAVVETAVPQLDEIVESAQTAEEEVYRRELERQQLYYTERIAELEERLARTSSWSEAGKVLERQLERLKGDAHQLAQQRPPRVEAEADLIAVRLVAPTLVQVTETWQRPTGDAFHVSYEWDLRADRPTELPGDDGEPVSTLAVCDEDHVVDLSRLAHCPGCGRDRCAGCAGGVTLTPCALCGVALCIECRPEEICIECQMAPPFDGGTPVGEVPLGHGAVAVITPHRISVQRPDGSTLEVLADSGRAAQQSPTMRWLAGVAGAEVGLIRGGDAELDIPADEIELTRGRHVEHTIDPSGGSGVDVDALELLDEAPPVDSRPRDAVTSWAQEMVDRSTFAPGPALVVETIVMATSLVVVGGSLVVRSRTARPDGSVIMIEEALQPTPDASGLAGRGVALPLSRVHRAFKTTLPDGNEVLLTDGTSSAEDLLALAAIAAEHGDPEAVVAATAPPAIDELASPGGDVELVSRSIEPVWSPADSGDHEPCAVWPEVFERPPTEQIPEIVVPDTVQALDAARPARILPLDVRTRLVEVWRGPHGEARADRVIAPGETGLPHLSDTGAPAADFEIDSAGHLHQPNAGWACPSCGSQLCLGCGDAGALGPCEVCGQTACGMCRTTRVGEVTSRCVICAGATCTACGHDTPVSSCRLCARTACAQCTTDGFCQTCASLAPADDDDRGRLTDILQVGDESALLVGHDDDAEIVVVSSTARLELAVLDGERIRHWWSGGPTSLDALQLAIAVGRRLRRPAPLPVTLDLVEPPAPDAQELALRLERQPIALLHIQQGSSTDAALGPVDLTGVTYDPTAVAEAVLERELADHRVVLEPASEAQQAALDRLAPRPTGQDASRLRVVASYQLHDTHLTPAGLVSTTVMAHEPHRALAPWRPATDEERRYWADLTGGTVLETCQADGVAATLIAIGPAALVAMHTGAELRCIRLDDAPQLASLAGLASWLGTGHDLIEVADVVLPDDAPQVTVAFANHVARQWRPTLTEVETVATSTEPLARLLALTEPVDLPLLITEASPRDTLPAGLVSELVQRAVTAAGARPRRVVIGYEAEDTWQVGEHQVVVAYRRAPGQLRPDIAPSPGPVTGPVLHLDRAGHLADVTTLCPYCKTATCDACPDRAAACMLCDQVVCGRCRTSELPCCPACTSATRVGMLGRRRLPGRPAVAVRGSDALHSVVVMPIGGGVAQVIVEEGKTRRELTRRVPAGLAAHYDRLTSSTAFT